MNKFITFTFFLILSSNFVYGQVFYKEPLKVKDILIALDNFEHLRPILLESGFKLSMENKDGESWSSFEISKNRHVMLSIQYYLGRTIFFRIHKEMPLDYLKGFHNDISTVFPDKRAERIKIKNAGDEWREDYILVYYNSSDVTVKYVEDSDIITYTFE